MNDLVEYKPKIKIHLMDKSEIITDAKHKDIIMLAWKKKTVIEIWSIVVSWHQIIKIEPLEYNDYNQIDFEVPQKYKKAIDARAKLYQDRILRYPTEETIKKWCMRLDQWLSLDAEPEQRNPWLSDKEKEENLKKRQETKEYFQRNPKEWERCRDWAKEFFKDKEWFKMITPEAQKTLILSKASLIK